MKRVVMLVALGALALPAAGSALTADPATFQLAWSERAVSRNKAVMSFRVKLVHLEFEAWAAEVTFANRSQKTVTIKPQFALLVSQTKKSERYEALVARRSRPPLPRSLRHGQSWTGTLAGPGRPRRGTWVRFNFGYFVGEHLFPGSKGFAWITDHSFQVGETA